MSVVTCVDRLVSPGTATLGRVVAEVQLQVRIVLLIIMRITCSTVDAACALSERLGPLLDPDYLAGAYLLTDATACAVSERFRPLFDPGSLAGTNCPAYAAACAVSKRLGPLLDPGFLAGTNCPADAAACAVSERLGPLLDPGYLAGTNCPADAIACVGMIRPTMFHVQQFCDS